MKFNRFNNRGEIATTLTLISLAAMLAGVILGGQEAVREGVRKYISRASTAALCPKANCQVRVVDGTLKVYRDTSDPAFITVEGNFCFNSDANSGTHNGRLWMSKDSRGKDVVGPVRPYSFTPGGGWPGPCDRDGILLKNKHLVTPSSQNSFIFKVPFSDFGGGACPAIYLNYISVGGGSETFDERSFAVLDPAKFGLCGPTTPTTNPSITVAPSPTPGACRIKIVSYVKERLADGRIADLNVNKRDVKWYTMSLKQRERHGSRYNPSTEAENNLGFTSGKTIIDADVTFPLQAASNDELGRKYEYREGDRECVKLFYDSSTYEIESADPGPGTVKDTTVRDEICQLPLACRVDYSYGWVLKKKGGPTSCPLQTPENKEKCTPKNVQAGIRRDSKGKVSYTKADVTWSPIIDPVCEFDSHIVEIKDDTGSIVCSRTLIPKDETDITCSVTENRSGTSKQIDKYEIGTKYTAEVRLLKNEPPACFSDPGTDDFIVPGPTGGPSQPPTQPPSDKTYQIDLYDLNAHREGSDHRMCWAVANTARNNDNFRSGLQDGYSCAGNASGNVDRLFTTYTNTSSANVTLRWQTHRCNGLNRECRVAPDGTNGTRSEEGFPNNVVAPGQSVTCTWTDPSASVSSVTCNTGTTPASGGASTGGSTGSTGGTGGSSGGGGSTGGSGGGSTGGGSGSGGGSTGGTGNCSCVQTEPGRQTGLCSSGCAADKANKKSCTIGAQGNALCRTPGGSSNSPTTNPASTADMTVVNGGSKDHTVDLGVHGYSIEPVTIKRGASHVFRNVPKSTTLVYFVTSPTTKATCEESVVSDKCSFVGFRSTVTLKDTATFIDKIIATYKFTVDRPYPITGAKTGIFRLRPIICLPGTTEAQYRSGWPILKADNANSYGSNNVPIVGNSRCLRYPQLFEETRRVAGFSQSAEMTVGPDKARFPTVDLNNPNHNYIVGCSYDFDSSGFGENVQYCDPKPIKGGTVKADAKLVEMTYNAIIDPYTTENTVTANYLISNTSSAAIDRVEMKICDQNGACETKSQAVGLTKGQSTAIKASFRSLQGQSLTDTGNYIASCQVRYSNGSQQSCPSQSFEFGNPVYYKLTVQADQSLQSSAKLEKNLADVNADGANTALDCGKMIANYGTSGADANLDSKTDSLDLSLCHKWSFRNR